MGMEKDDILTSDLLYIWSSMSDVSRQLRHCHAEYEIHYFVQGDVEYRIEGQCFIPAPESILLIPANCFHGFSAQPAALYKRVSIHFQPELLTEDERKPLLEMFHTGRNYYPGLSHSHIDFLIKSLLDCRTMTEPLQKNALRHRTASLLTHIYQIQAQNMTHSAPVDERIQSVLWYLNSNLRKPLSVTQVAARFHFSKNHLNVLFRRETGTTVNQYIRLKRLALAKQEMRNGCGAEEAAYNVGFNDYSNFYRAYKAAFGVSPTGLEKAR